MIHEQKPYQGERAGYIECAEYYANHVVNIPCSTNLQEKDILFVVEKIREIL